LTQEPQSQAAEIFARRIVTGGLGERFGQAHAE
jgi:hypothetical protein